jgi:hypothetical protein
MARYYQTSETPIIEDGMSKVPFNELAQILAIKDKNLNDAKTEALKIGQDLKLNPYYIDRDAATQIATSYQSEIQALQNKISGDKVNAHRYMPELEALKNKLFLDSTTGNIAKINAKGVEMNQKRKAIADALAKDPNLGYASAQERMAYMDKQYLERGGFQSDVSPEVMLTSRPNLQEAFVKAVKNHSAYEYKSLTQTDVGGVKTTTGYATKGLEGPELIALAERTIASDEVLRKSFEEEALIKGKTYDEVVKEAVKNLDMSSSSKATVENISKTDVSESAQAKIDEEKERAGGVEVTTQTFDYQVLSKYIVKTTEETSTGTVEKIDYKKTYENLAEHFQSEIGTADAYLRNMQLKHLGKVSTNPSIEEIESALGTVEKIEEFRSQLEKANVITNIAKYRLAEVKRNLDSDKTNDVPLSTFIPLRDKTTAQETRSMNKVFRTNQQEKAFDNTVETNYASVPVFADQTTGVNYEGKPLIFITDRNRDQYTSNLYRKTTSREKEGKKAQVPHPIFDGQTVQTPIQYKTQTGEIVYLVDLGAVSSVKPDQMLKFINDLKTSEKTVSILEDAVSAKGIAGEPGSRNVATLTNQTNVKYKKGSANLLEKLIDDGVGISYTVSVGNDDISFVTGTNTNGNKNFKLSSELSRELEGKIEFLKKKQILEDSNIFVKNITDNRVGGVGYTIKGIPLDKPKKVSLGGNLYEVYSEGQGGAIKIRDARGNVSVTDYNLALEIIYKALGNRN